SLASEKSIGRQWKKLMQPAETPHANCYRTENFTLERISRERHLYSNTVIRPTITCWRIHWLSSRLRKDKVEPYGLLLPLSTATCNQFTNRKSTGLSSTLQAMVQ